MKFKLLVQFFFMLKCIQAENWVCKILQTPSSQPVPQCENQTVFIEESTQEKPELESNQIEWIRQNVTALEIEWNSKFELLKENFLKKIEKQIFQFAINNYNNTSVTKEHDDGWISLYNVYQYKLTNAESWENSRKICKNWGGDLAVYGVQSMNARKILWEKLEFHIAWIGLQPVPNDENTWHWINGEVAKDSNALWSTGEPNNHGEEKCGEIWINLMTNNVNCNWIRSGLCEKSLLTAE